MRQDGPTAANVQASFKRKSQIRPISNHHKKQQSGAISDIVNATPIIGHGIPPKLQRRKSYKRDIKQTGTPFDIWKRRWRHVLKYPRASIAGRVYNSIMLTAIVGNFLPMILETMDGPANGGSDPAYPYLPDSSTFRALDVMFSLLFTCDLLFKMLVAKRQLKFWTRFGTWIDIFGVLPWYGSVFMTKALGWTLEQREPVELYLKLMRQCRIVRVAYILRNIDGMRVLRLTVTECIPPLKITLFFLVTIVLLIATMLYYSEPCYHATECSFTDILNAAYFIMATVATVGYGDQTPDLDNPMSVILTTIAMIFGTLYLAMPLAIIGIKYELNWLRFINHSRTSRSTIELRARAKAAGVESLHPRENYVTLLHQNLMKQASRLHKSMHRYMSIPPEEIIENGINTSKAHQALNALHGAGRELILSFHVFDKSMRCFELQHESKKEKPKNLRRRSSMATLATGAFTKALKAIQTQTRTDTFEHVPPTLQRQDTEITLIERSQNLRKFLRYEFQQRNATSWLNRFLYYELILSLLIFYGETIPEFQVYGKTSLLCQRSMASYCMTKTSDTDPGCFVWIHTNDKPQVTTKKLDFFCLDSIHSSVCYGNDLNYGSNDTFITCNQTYFSDTKTICTLRECQSLKEPIFDLTDMWKYPEHAFRYLFTLEFLMRLYASKNRRRFIRSISAWIDILALVPHYSDTVVATIRNEPVIYPIVPTFPNILSVLPILKSLRILKLGRNFKASTVLARTASLTYTRLVIPMFFLFLACVSAGAIFFEFEQGVPCSAHLPCSWLNRDLMNFELAAPFPIGKRILIQVDKLTLLTDMWRSTWLSAVTFTAVGYGDMVPRTPIGRLLDIIAMILSSCYTAMPLSLIGGQFYHCYEEFNKRQVSGLGVGSTRVDTPDPRRKARTLSSEDYSILNRCGVLVLLVDEILQNTDKLNELRRYSMLASFRYRPPQSSSQRSLLGRKMSGTNKVSTMDECEKKKHQIIELRDRIHLASTHVMTIVLRLSSIVEQVASHNLSHEFDEEFIEPKE